jgi:hydrogenase maturation protein HypF
MADVELYGTEGCPFTSELREQLLWRGDAFVEYDVERDDAALRRMLTLTDGQRGVPVLVDHGRVVQIGWEGRTCVVAPPPPVATEARDIRVRGTVQGVGFRPFVYRLAQEHAITGWVRNDDDGVRIHAEGGPAALDAFRDELATSPPRAARIDTLEANDDTPVGCEEFSILESERRALPTTIISPDLPVCERCLAELFDRDDRRTGYPYINCTECGPRFSIMLGLPYDRPETTMRDWAMCVRCATEYATPTNRRFHAQPVACPECGPHYALLVDGRTVSGDDRAITEAGAMLRRGAIVGIKGLGGYHLACDADAPSSVRALRERKFRKERPFALMVRDLDVARRTIAISPDVEVLLTSSHRPIVLAPWRVALAEVAPDCSELGVMLPYTPLHHLLFARGAPERLVMTSANRSSEPIAYRDDDAIARLAGIADALLVGARPIARRVDDSVVRIGAAGPVVLRRSRGYAPGVVARLPATGPVLALGADLKNTVTLVVGGNAIMSQHIGDLEHADARSAFLETVRDLTAMYRVADDELCVVHDRHPDYVSAVQALDLPCRERRAVQHHRAHVASVLAERGALDERVLGVAFDGTGYGDDGTIWGGELFAGSVRSGLTRVGHLRSARLPGGDAAARHPVQAAAGFLAELSDDATLPDLRAAPFHFPERYEQAMSLLRADVRCFRTTSVGRLFDSAAALLGFNRAITYEGQAAIWLEELARTAPPSSPLPMPFTSRQLDFRPTLLALIESRVRGDAPAGIARAFHAGLARALACAVRELSETYDLGTVALSGGVFQNDLLLSDVLEHLASSGLRVWTNHAVPANDGGISLGQAALAAAAKSA